MDGIKKDYVFHRDLKKKYPIITHGAGSYLFDDDGKKYLDACSGAVAANLGHGISSIGEAMAEQAKKAAFVHTMRFETKALHQLAETIGKMAPDNLNKVYFTTGGSEANESALKLARQYHRDAGRHQKHIVIGRWQSYHGNTIGSLSAGGDVKRRHAYTPNLLNYAHVYSPYCHRCPYDRLKDDCLSNQNWTCVTDIERSILELGPENVSAFIAEPIVGSQQGAVPPPLGYFKKVRELCDRYQILLIIDEVMTGFGRTGTNFATEQIGIVPDMITFGKGVSAGYAPLAGMIVHDRVIDGLIKNSDGKFIHGYTYSGHPVAVAAGLAALDVYMQESVLENVKKQGPYLFNRLLELKQKHAIISDVRGRGLLMGIELVKDRKQDLLFDPAEKAAERLNGIAMDLGAVFYSGSGSIDGTKGEHLIISPPLNVTKTEMDEMVRILDESFTIFNLQLRKDELYEITK
ncbi:aminotransferase family protein [Neobacillus cucumis]|uniref:aminotransferase family protein n=1 Tax=Neobacillus cucumis TaxID=1740721 RepID=UPI0019642B8A|nr:aminotransferase class III-fold pyridoxal phosphate-dependent enzyme [Neobacillus cucumis]MBM7651114.1 adenosylmethionine-8-amino-7-oxononanoate aminotransferase [Neobacillus cucumis]